MKLTKAQIELLIAVRDDQGIYPLVKTIGFGWAIELGLIAENRPSPPYLDFRLTDLGRTALREAGK